MGRLSKLARWLGLLGGLGAAAWAARDRFISLTLPREPEPPKFRPAPAPDGDDLTVINGIGPVFAERLAAGGITSFAALAEADADTVADLAGVNVERAARWIADADTADA